MHGSRTENASLVEAIVSSHGLGDADCVVCPPFVYLADVARMLRDSTVALGAQDVGAEAQGAFTGEVSAAMLRDVGCTMAIVGHSERRSYHGEGSQLVADKAKAALAEGLTPIVCVGETLAQREANQTEAVVAEQLQAVIAALGAQLADIVVAYEPVWAIGTGKTASPEQAQAVHAFLRAQLVGALPAAARVPLLYGGSVKPDNAAELFAQADIDGGLIGGASLKAADFVAIARAAA